MHSRRLLQHLSCALGPFCLGISIAACGGSSGGSTGDTTSGGGGGGNNNPTVTSVNVTPTSVTCTLASQTFQLSAVVAGTNNPPQTVMWAVSPAGAGTISSNGLYTCPSANQSGNVSIVATSTFDTSVSGVAAVTTNIPVVPTVTSVSVTPPSVTCTQASQTFQLGADVAGTNNPPQTVTWAVSPAGAGSITQGGSYTCPAANQSGNVSVVATSTFNTSVSGVAAVTMNIPVTAVTQVSLVCNTLTTNNIDSLTCTPTVTGTGQFTNTVNLSLSPAGNGTLSASSGVSSGTSVTFTPAFNPNNGKFPYTATVAAVSTANSTKSDQATITVDLRTITIDSSTGPIRLPNCADLFSFDAEQTNIVSGDTLDLHPYQPSTFTSTPAATFPILMGIGNNPTEFNPCSPGAYSEYVTGTDGARSNTHYIPIFGPYNMSAGHNANDEVVADFAAGATYLYNIETGAQDGPVFPHVAVVSAVDGGYLVTSDLGSTGVGAYNLSTGLPTTGINTITNIVGIAANSGIAGATNNQQTSFTPDSAAGNVANVPSGSAPTPIAMTPGCLSAQGSASGMAFDVQGTTLYRSDATLTSANNVTAVAKGNVSLSGFASASQIPLTTAARYVSVWNSNCDVAVIAPVVTGTNPDGSTAWENQLALVDMSAGKQIGAYVGSAVSNGVTTNIPNTITAVASDNTGSAVYISAVDEAAGTTSLTEVSWTLNAGQPTFTITTLASSADVPTGIYAAALDVLPNGQIIVAQRPSNGEYYVLAAQ
jgi:hypothetical protein